MTPRGDGLIGAMLRSTGDKQTAGQENRGEGPSHDAFEKRLNRRTLR